MVLSGSSLHFVYKKCETNKLMENRTTYITNHEHSLKRYVLMIGDLHFGRFSNDQSELEESVRYFDEFVFPLLNQLNEKFPDNVSIIQMGDVFDNKSSIGTLTGNRVIDVFLKLSEKNDVYVLVGNHDTVYKDIRHINNSKSISLIPRVHVVPNITRLITEDGTPVYLFPNFGNKELFSEAVNLCSPDSYLFGHDEISGFYYEGKEVSEHHSLPKSEFSKFKHVFMGHIHKPQEDENITYVGSAYHTRINEWRNVPQVVILDTLTGNIKKIVNRVSSRYIKIDLFKLLDMKRSEALEFVRGNKISVQCPNDSIMRFQTYKITETLDGYKKLEYKQVFDKSLSSDVDSVDDYEDSDNKLSDVELSSDIMQYVQEYVNSLDSLVIQGSLVNVSDAVKQKMMDVLQNIYNSVSEKSKPEDEN